MISDTSKRRLVAEQGDLLNETNTNFSLDDLIHVLGATFFHPAYVWSVAIYYYLRPLNHLKWAIAFCILIDLLYLLQYLNRRYLRGRNAFKLQNSDVVVITGGSSGLGRALAILFRTKGVETVISLDIKPVFEKGEIHDYGIKFVQCDVADDTKVESTLHMIEKSYGHVTVLVNNAGVLNGNEAIVDMSKQSIRRTIDVNLLASFWTAKAVLPNMIANNRGYIVTIASVLGYLGPSKAAAYAASKGGLIVFHDSLRHELQNTDIKTLLVTPGQLKTSMFDGVKTPNSLIAPIQDPITAAMQIIEAVEQSRCDTVAMPFYCKFVPLCNVVPSGIMDILRSFFRMDEAMDGLNNGVSK